MSSYTNYSVSDWNHRLLSHYFGRKSPDEPAVSSLLVTEEELARGVNASESEAAQARDAFVTCIRSTMSGRFFPAKFDYYGAWLRERRSIEGAWKSTPPDFVAHLVFACLAATESPEDLADERSYIARLDALCESSRTDDDLRLMPALWKYLSDWLDQADGTAFRGLALPPDNGWTRIGYTVRLAFPGRHDQQTLVDVLRDADCLGHEPPVGRVLFAVGNAKDRFRRRFQEVFIDFRTKYQTDDLSGSALREHAFWAAVQNATRHGYGLRADPDYVPEVQLLAEVDDDRFFPFLVSKEKMPAEFGFQADTLPTKVGMFAWLLSSPPTAGGNATVEHAVSEIFQRRKRVRTLDSAVQQGVLLFAEFDAGTFELVSDADTRAVRHALVRNDLALEFRQRFSRQNTTNMPGPIEGWTVFLDVEVSPVAPNSLDGTKLEHVWALQRGIPVTRLRVVGGVRIEGGWLGSKEALPKVGSHGEGDLWFRREEGSEQLLNRGPDGLWLLPSTDLSGPARIVQRHAGQNIDQIRLEFVALPSVEAFKVPSVPETWLTEAVGHSVSVRDQPLPITDEHTDWGALADQVVLLGPNVGQFVTDPARAAWQIARFSNRDRLRRGSLRSESAVPHAQVTRDQLRRRWRKLLFNSAPDSTDPEAATARSFVRRKALDEQLPHEEAEHEHTAFAASLGFAPARNLDRVVTVLVARLNARTGIPLRDWYELLGAIAGIADRDVVRSISRGWQEAGLIDLASSTRWSSFLVYGRLPTLATFPCGSGWGATLTGLALPSTVRGLVNLAKNQAITYEARGSCSEWVPGTVSFRAARLEALSSLAREARVGCTPLSIRAIEELARRGRARAVAPPPVNYVDRRPIPLWRTGTNAPSDIAIFRWHRRDSPDFWEVVGKQSRYWTYDPNSARLWASLIAGVTPVVPAGEVVLAERAFLPLALARFLSGVTGLRSGPYTKCGGQHCYPVHSPYTSRWLLETLNALLTND